MGIGWLTCIPAVLLPHSLCRFTTANAPVNRQMPIASVIRGSCKKTKQILNENQMVTMNKKNQITANIEQAKKLAEESILLYNDNSPLRLCILGIPTLGPIIDTILTSKGQQISYKRLIGFFRELENEIKELDERLINLEFVESDEFYDLLIKSIESSLKTRHEEKRKLYAKIIKNRCLVQKSELNPEFYFDIINELTIEELLVAKKLYELKTTGEYEQLVKGQPENSEYLMQDQDVLALTDLPIEKDDYTFILLRLQKIGLIKEQTGMIFGYIGGIYDITGTFKKLMKSIEI